MAANVADGKEVESSRHIDQSNNSESDSFGGQLSLEEHPEDTQETTATNGDSNDKASDDNNKQPYIIKVRRNQN